MQVSVSTVNDPLATPAVVAAHGNVNKSQLNWLINPYQVLLRLEMILYKFKYLL